MNNFEYSNPTRLVFGKGEESRIGELMRARVPGDESRAGGLRRRFCQRERPFGAHLRVVKSCRPCAD